MTDSLPPSASVEVAAAASLFGVLAHPVRLAVLSLLNARAPRTPGELQEALGLERTSLSHQLRLLREARLVTMTRDGRRRLYALADHHVAHIVRDALAHVREGAS
jgi:DNA-binding transcriptional ArsR family regulator